MKCVHWSLGESKEGKCTTLCGKRIERNRITDVESGTTCKLCKSVIEWNSEYGALPNEKA